MLDDNLQKEINDKLNKLDIDSFKIFSDVMDIKTEDNVDFNLLDTEIKDLESQMEDLNKTVDSTNNKESDAYKNKIKELKSKKRKISFNLSLCFIPNAFVYILIACDSSVLAILYLFLSCISYLPELRQRKMIESQIKYINEVKVSIDNKIVDKINRTLDNAKRFVDSKRRKKELINSLNVNNYMLDEDYSKEEDNSLKLILR